MDVTELPKLTLVIGGANSGKSAHGEALVRGSGLPRVYLATAQAFDGEMQAKIERHKATRSQAWTTLEVPLAVADAVMDREAGEALLLDCATMWLSNHLLSGADLDAQIDALLAALGACAARVVVVTNEVGMSIVPETALGRQFRTAQGLLNQRLAEVADHVVLVVAGIPVDVKRG